MAIKGYLMAWGSSLVGFFRLVLALIPFLLYKYGPALRAKSKFTDYSHHYFMKCISSSIYNNAHSSI